MSPLIALTRAVPPAINRCELTHLARTPIDYLRAVDEHDRYEAALRALGCVVERLPDAPDMPDSVFVEDTAIVFDGLAVIARPGAASRRGEVASAVEMLRRHRPLAFIQAPVRWTAGTCWWRGRGCSSAHVADERRRRQPPLTRRSASTSSAYQ
jgi:dimethylargininase